VGNCLTNAHNAFCLRHASAVPNPIQVFPWQGGFFRTQLPELAHWYHYFLGSAEAPWRDGKTQARLAQIDASLAFGHYDMRVVKPHVKSEVSLSRPTKARLIQAYQNDCASYIHATEYRALHKAVIMLCTRPFNGVLPIHVQMASGLTHVDISCEMWRMFELYGLRFVYWHESDGKNWDSTVQAAHRHWLWSIYFYLSSDLYRHASQCTQATGHIRGRGAMAFAWLVYVVMWTVFSGHQDTTVGNGMLRVEGAHATITGLPLSLRPDRAFGFVQGDDSLLALCYHQPKDLTLLRDTLDMLERRSGMTPSSATFECLSQASFLSAAFAPSSSGLHMFPLPGRVLAKLFWSVLSVPPRRQASYIRQIAESMRPVFRGFHAITEFLDWHVQAPDLEWHIEHKPHRLAPNGVVDWDTFVNQRYSVPNLPQGEMAAFLAVLTPGQSYLCSHPWAHHIIRVDLSDPADRVNTSLTPFS
jgi:hypothetical protein